MGYVQAAPTARLYCTACQEGYYLRDYGRRCNCKAEDKSHELSSRYVNEYRANLTFFSNRRKGLRIE